MINLKPQISHEGIDLIRDVLINVFSRGQSGKGLNPVEQVQVDIATLIDGLNDAGCEVPSDQQVRELERTSWDLILGIGRSNHRWDAQNLIEALNTTKANLDRQAVDRRLENCRKLMNYINGYDCYSEKTEGIHSFDKSMDEALEMMSILLKTGKWAEIVREQT